MESGKFNTIIMRARPHILEKIDSTLAIKIDSEKDREDGYPDLICRKCCHVISTFHTYKKTVDDGMARLSQEVRNTK